MKILELFCGTKSISKAFKEAGHETFTVDNDHQHNPNLCIDILDFDIKMLPKEWRTPNIIWASPPCTSFSVASIGRYWREGIPKHWKSYLGISIVLKTIDIIEQLNPENWFIENPRGMLRKQEFMLKFHRNTVTYCQYGDDRMKPTDIWTNALHWRPKQPCKNGSPCHISAPRGSPTGTQGLKDAIDRGRIPNDLCKEIVLVCENDMKEKQNQIVNYGGWDPQL